MDAEAQRQFPDRLRLKLAFNPGRLAADLERLREAVWTDRDGDLAFERGAARLHVPLATNPDVEFRLDGSRVVMEAGSTWYLRLSDPHRVSNKGATDRVHLVIDALTNEWLSAALDDAPRD